MTAPRITQFQIPKESRSVRRPAPPAPRGREITEQTGTKIDIEDDGTIKVAAVDDRGWPEGHRLD